MGSGHTLGERGGEQAHTVSISELPTHTHVANASSNNAVINTGPGGNNLGQSSGIFLYGPASNLTPMDAGAVTNTGGSQAHSNMQPFLVLTFCIALQGIFPSQN
jgi:microcystin-dependent protein